MGLALTARLPDGQAAAAASALTGTTGQGAVEVVRGAAAGPAALAAVVAWAVAAAAVAVLAAAWLAGAERRRVVAPAWMLAVVATLTEVVLLLLDGALADRRPAAALARLLFLAIGLVAGEALPRWAQRLLAGMVLLTVPLGAPFAGDPGGVAVASAITLIGVGLAAVGLRAGARRTHGSTVRTLGLVAVLAALAAVVAWPEPAPPTHRSQQVVAGIVFDVTVAPVAPGDNELHLYARDPAGQPVDLADVTADVAGRPAHELYPVTRDHWLSYVLELPPGDRWRLTLTAVTTGGDERAVVIDLAAS
jgi:hypothetical protein